MTRRARVTLRCLRDDLRLQLPPIETDLGKIEHPLLEETRRLAPTAPAGQKRILAIEHPLVYRLRHGRWRGATWLEDDAERFWLCGAALREQGSRNDPYELFVALHDAGRLLPDDDDRERDALERDTRILDAAADAIEDALANASSHPGQDVALRLDGLVDVRLHVTAPGEEVWVAIATRATDERVVEEILRNVLFRLVFEAAGTEIWEPRSDWPSGQLAWFEVARLGLRELPS